ncbi:MAG: phosphopyruvate hydratase [Catenulispora sp.]|nr:phosphopyruvate hydratase [Catenulispora sp.]
MSWEDPVNAYRITKASALQILDSRGNPTLSVTVELGDGTTATAGVPSGASTGAREAVELRDGDAARYGGKGVLNAAATVNSEIAELLLSRTWPGLEDIDAALIELDGTPNKSRLGANAVVGVSIACARALAAADRTPLWRWLSDPETELCLPVPHFNVINGGAHAANPLDFQEFMIAPLGAPSIAEAVRAGAEVYTALRRELVALRESTGLGDEGGFAPGVTEPEEALRLLVAAIEAAGYTPGRDGVSIALDPAANGFFQSDGRYRIAGEQLTSSELISRYAAMIERFPIHSIEDGLAEDDEAGWIAMTAQLGERIQIVGDDIFVTDPDAIARGAERGIANAALIKVNQIGTVTQTRQALAAARTAGYGAMISHRSGETCDDFIADLAVGSGAGQLKSGAPARGERVAKYNRLMAIADANPGLPYGAAKF